MSNKRKQMERRRQVAKARQSNSASRKPNYKGPAPKKEEPTKMTDVWVAVGIVAAVIIGLVVIYQLTVVRPAKQAQTISPTIAVTAPQTEPEQTSEPESATAAAPTSMSWSEPPAMQIDTAKSYEAIFKTVKGDIRVELYDDLAPNTVNNFVFLAREGYYDNTTFHRVMEGFMAQGGDPTGTGAGGPGYSFADEFDPSLRHDSEGILSMANSGANTNGSQFFITYAPQPHLDDVHSVFGKVTEGMDVLRSLTKRVPGDELPGDRIITIEIVES